MRPNTEAVQQPSMHPSSPPPPALDHPAHTVVRTASLCAVPHSSAGHHAVTLASSLFSLLLLLLPRHGVSSACALRLAAYRAAVAPRAGSSRESAVGVERRNRRSTDNSLGTQPSPPSVLVLVLLLGPPLPRRSTVNHVRALCRPGSRCSYGATMAATNGAQPAADAALQGTPAPLVAWVAVSGSAAAGANCSCIWACSVWCSAVHKAERQSVGTTGDRGAEES